MKDLQKLFEAIDLGETQDALDVLKRNPSLVNGVDENRQSAYWRAGCRGRADIIRGMFEEPIISVLDPHLTDKWSRDALEIAEAYGHREIVELIGPIYGLGFEDDDPLMELSWQERVKALAKRPDLAPSKASDFGDGPEFS